MFLFLPLSPHNHPPTPPHSLTSVPGDPDPANRPDAVRRFTANYLHLTDANAATAARFTRLRDAWPPEPLHPAEVACHNKWNRTAEAVEAWTQGEWTREGGVDGAPLVPNARRLVDLQAAARYWQAQAHYRDGRPWRPPAGEAAQVALTRRPRWPGA